MARLRAEIKRGFLRSLWRTAKADSKTVAEMLDAFQAECFGWVKSGRIVANTSGGGYSTAFAELSAGLDLSPLEVFALSEEFFAVQTDTLAASSSLTGDDLINGMMADDRMQGIREYHVDDSLLRFYPAYGPTR